jgi:hypothetical protein
MNRTHYQVRVNKAMSNHNKRIDCVFVAYRTDGKRPFGLFFDETAAEAFIKSHLTPEFCAVARRTIAWRWSRKESTKADRLKKQAIRMGFT